MLPAVIVLLAQVTQGPEAEPPNTYVFHLEDGKKYYGTVVKEERGGDLLVIELDEPWKTRLEKKTINRSELKSQVRELKGARRKRIEEGFQERGFTLVDTPAQPRLPIPTEQVVLAERARAMALALEETPPGASDAPGQPLTHPPAGPPDQTPPVEPGSPSPGARWGLAALLTLGALVIVGIVLKTMVLA